MASDQIEVNGSITPLVAGTSLANFDANAVGRYKGEEETEWDQIHIYN
jgi:hypothetical protein